VRPHGAGPHPPPPFSLWRRGLQVLSLRATAGAGRCERGFRGEALRGWASSPTPFSGGEGGFKFCLCGRPRGQVAARGDSGVRPYGAGPHPPPPFSGGRRGLQVLSLRATAEQVAVRGDSGVRPYGAGPHPPPPFSGGRRRLQVLSLRATAGAGRCERGFRGEALRGWASSPNPLLRGKKGASSSVSAGDRGGRSL
jgi:hypothetical protein